MHCFGGVFRHWLRVLGGFGDSGGGNGIRFGVAVAGFFFRFHKPLIRHG